MALSKDFSVEVSPLQADGTPKDYVVTRTAPWDAAPEGEIAHFSSEQMSHVRALNTAALQAEREKAPASGPICHAFC
jgi:hypothetical protein